MLLSPGNEMSGTKCPGDEMSGNEMSGERKIRDQMSGYQMSGNGQNYTIRISISEPNTSAFLAFCVPTL